MDSFRVIYVRGFVNPCCFLELKKKKPSHALAAVSSISSMSFKINVVYIFFLNVEDFARCDRVSVVSGMLNVCIQEHK